MAQHDFVPAWLNFSTPQPAKSPAATLDKQSEPHHHKEGRNAVSRRRHNSSDGFFNNGSLRAPAGDGWQQPSLLLRHDSVDSGVSKGGHSGLAGGPCWKETPSWHGGPRGAQDGHHHHHHHQGRHPKRGGGDRDRQGGHRQRNGNFHPRKGTSYQDKFPNEERKDNKEDKLKFVEEDFPSLNPETTGKPGTPMRPVAANAGVWENPPSGKQMVSKMLVIKKVSKEDPSTAFSAGFASAGGGLPANGAKAPITGSSVYKNLVPKPAVAPTKSTQWKAGTREIAKSGRDSVFPNPVSAVKTSNPVSVPQHNNPKEHPSSTTPPIDIAPSRLKLMRRGPDRKSDFLRALKDEGTGELTTSSSPGTSGEGESSTPEPKAYSEDVCHENGLSYSLSDSDTEHLSSSLEAEHRLLKAMGWQEYPENDDNFLPLTEDELREFQTKTEQLKRNGLQNGVLPRARGVTLHFTPWRSVAEAHVEEASESETSSSSQTSDDDDDDNRTKS
ncbi:vasculin-like protein 1 isoform X1 [Syngnathoides biaculeatus]|uniref:vasculin-like protein 1 isoform X1 n=1 Tax=Syngnathoides biaculeatus TaxID=300417 RepID=UPI002ADDB53B|nr:vasculin-like protein 1 isoform X1 [Syngnathoides biaculeatus]XP_061695068.1 vasculin-like protein 1 isoform X1 [Syngnathoides biaculeatus]XP_061695069.1 vasculin-like protein 1 isoform X1 [Syngnathoides biaculeatus]